jgi:hypothetical protein
MLLLQCLSWIKYEIEERSESEPSLNLPSKKEHSAVLRRSQHRNIPRGQDYCHAQNRKVLPKRMKYAPQFHRQIQFGSAMLWDNIILYSNSYDTLSPYQPKA